MKKVIYFILFCLSMVCIFYIKKFDSMISSESEFRYVDDEVLIALIDIEADEFVQEEEIINETEDVVIEPEVNEYEVLTGRMSGYGPDCYGCSGYLAYGPYVGDGTIYYNDSEYGQVRIVAGDRSLEFGTIVKINDSMLAIVLDRGGAIGIGKSFLFDLLYPSEAEANQNGILVDAVFEILRRGF